MVQGMELQSFRSSSFSTEGATYIPRAAITFGHYILVSVCVEVLFESNGRVSVCLCVCGGVV